MEQDNKSKHVHEGTGIEFITKIIEAEQNARKLADETQKKCEAMRSELSASTDDLRREYFVRAEARIKKIHEQNEVFAIEDIAALDESYKRELENIETAFEQNQDQWAEKLFNMIIARG